MELIRFFHGALQKTTVHRSHVYSKAYPMMEIHVLLTTLCQGTDYFVHGATPTSANPTQKFILHYSKGV